MTSYNRWLIKLKEKHFWLLFLKNWLYTQLSGSSNFDTVISLETKIHNISLIYQWLVLLPNATLNKMESQNTWVALIHCTALSKLFTSCLLHHPCCTEDQQAAMTKDSPSISLCQNARAKEKQQWEGRTGAYTRPCRWRSASDASWASEHRDSRS